MKVIEEKMVGDKLTLFSTLYGPITFVVIGRNHDAENTITVISEKVIDILPFSGTLFKDVRNIFSSGKYNNAYCYNTTVYKYSQLQYWMNGLYTNYNQYNYIIPFCNSLEDDIKRAIVPVKKSTINRITDEVFTTTDSIFLLSATEVGLEANPIEGHTYDYFYKNSPLTSSIEKNVIDSGDLKESPYWLRSQDETGENVLLVDTKNKLNPVNPKITAGFRPAMCLDFSMLHR